MPDNCPKDCPLEPRVAALEKADEQHRQTHRELFSRVGKLETENAVQNANYQAIIDTLGKMDAKNDRLVEKVESIEKCVSAQLQTINELNERGRNNQKRLDALEAKPGKRWEGLVEKAIWAVCAAVIAFLLGRVGL